MITKYFFLKSNTNISNNYKHLINKTINNSFNIVPKKFKSNFISKNNNSLHKFRIQTFNNISMLGLSRMPTDLYEISEKSDNDPHAIILRSHNLTMDEVAPSIYAIARCGTGTNNIPLTDITAAGIPVFNTPGANANSVKELLIMSILLASRDILGGIQHMKKLGEMGLARQRVEKDKSLFKGREIAGKTLGVIGLGNIGSALARDASMLGMKVCGYDPNISLYSAMKLPENFELFNEIKQVLEKSDYISLNIPFINKPIEEGGTKYIIDSKLLKYVKHDAVLLNFARGELVDSDAVYKWMNSLDGINAKYITDFPDDKLWNHDRVTVIPHLGASTKEAEDNAAIMAVDTIMNYLSTGNIVNSVNFPETILQPVDEKCIRIAIINNNKSKVLARILSVFGNKGINIVQQVNKSKGDIAYNVIDIEYIDDFSWDDIHKELIIIDNVISSRYIFNHSILDI
tara:strand:+ start:1628 stop:3004 length:1377 start_codon:yes stop_codon:yes gene_type:complete